MTARYPAHGQAQIEEMAMTDTPMTNTITTTAPESGDAEMFDSERERRWRLAVGAEEAALGETDRGLSAALTALYGDGEAEKKKGRGGLGRSSPRAIAHWIGDIRSFFPQQVVQIVQKDAFERLGL
ncbi:MAG: hypothetical protein LBR88_03300, partial [Zoogloeaceae bacterium]|nr:hypothetical protein [Zoogloeaceae bacterium]